MSKQNKSRMSRLLIGSVATLTGLGLLGAALVTGIHTAPALKNTEALAAARNAIVSDMFQKEQESSQGDLSQLKPISLDQLNPTDPTEYTMRVTDSMFKNNDSIVIPKAAKAVDRAWKTVGNAFNVCDGDSLCAHLCDHVAGWIWGYEDYSGYYSATTHWETALNTGVAHPGDRNVPVGALLFWDGSSKFGHVAIYVGNGMVISNMLGKNGPNIYFFSADLWEKTFGAHYRGWALPVFRGEDPGARL